MVEDSVAEFGMEKTPIVSSMEKTNSNGSLLNEFEIVALGIVGSCDFTCYKRMEILDKNGNPTGKFTVNAKGTLYKKYNPEKDKAPAFRDVITNELYSSIYARLLIKKRQENEN